MNFNYATYDKASGLTVAGNVFDVSTGTPVFVSLIPMAEVFGGVYDGVFIETAGRSYLVISCVYTDGTFTTIDDQRSPDAECFNFGSLDNSLLSFNYGAYDLSATLTINTRVYDMTSGSSVLVNSSNLIHVMAGVYFGQYQGTVPKSYLVMSTPTDASRSPASDSFTTRVMINSVNVFQAATLKGQSIKAALLGQNTNATLRGTND